MPTLAMTPMDKDVAEPTAREAVMVPKLIHFIWLGDNKIPLRYVWNILNCQAMNGENYQINLWINPQYFSADPKVKLCPRYAFLQKYGVTLRNYSEELKDESASVLEAVNYLHMRRPVVASDILRLVALGREGGIYYDADTYFRKPLPPTIVFFADTSFIVDETGSSSSDHPSSELSNSFLASLPGGKEITFLLDNIQKGLRTTTPQILAAINDLTIIKTTGPIALRLYLAKLRSPFDFSRLNYPGLSGVKSHTYDGVWRSSRGDAKVQKEREHRRSDALAGAGIVLWRMGKLPASSRFGLDAQLCSAIATDDLANPAHRDRVSVI